MAATGSAGTPHYMAPEMLKTSRHGRILPQWPFPPFRFSRYCGMPIASGASLACPALQRVVRLHRTVTVQLWREGGCLGARLCPVRSRLFLPRSARVEPIALCGFAPFGAMHTHTVGTTRLRPHWLFGAVRGSILAQSYTARRGQCWREVT